MTDKDELVERPMGYHEMHAHLTSERDKWRKVAVEMALPVQFKLAEKRP